LGFWFSPQDSDDAKGAESTTSDRALQALAVTQIVVAPTSANDDGKGMKHDHHHHNMAVTPAAAAAGQVLPRCPSFLKPESCLLLTLMGLKVR
jgi:hypothetical protein